MADTEEIRIQRMGLVKVPTSATDLIVDDEDYTKKNELYEALRDSEILEKKPITAPFEIAENPGDKDYIPCHLPVPILKIEGTILKPLSKTNKVTKVPAQYTWAMEEAAEWCKEYITFDEVKGKSSFSSFKIASNPETYAVPEYNEYIPTHVVNAEEKYKKIFLDVHKEAYKDLKMDSSQSSKLFKEKRSHHCQHHPRI